MITMGVLDYDRLAYPAELINFDPYDPGRAEVIPVSDEQYLIRYANVPRDDVIYIRMDLGHFDQAQMFEL